MFHRLNINRCHRGCAAATVGAMPLGEHVTFQCRMLQVKIYQTHFSPDVFVDTKMLVR